MDWVIRRYERDADRKELQDRVAVEEPLEVSVNGNSLVTLMRLPGMDRELAVGFCLTEGLIEDASQVISIDRPGPRGNPGPDTDASYRAADAGGAIALEFESPLPGDRFAKPYLAPGEYRAADNISREDLDRRRVSSPVKVASDVIFGLGEALTREQEVFEGTAGAHGAGVFTVSGELVVVAEDVGRHNALDKAIGWCALNDVPLNDKILFNSGRISCAMTVKAVRVGIPVIVSMAASTSRVLSVAEAADLTVIGFSTGRRFSVYTCHERIVP